jgi:hypothetical protein
MAGGGKPEHEPRGARLEPRLVHLVELSTAIGQGRPGPGSSSDAVRKRFTSYLGPIWIALSVHMHLYAPPG